MKAVSSDVRDVLDAAVGGKIQNYEISFEDTKLEGENFLGEILFVSLTDKNSKKVVHLIIKQALESLKLLQNLNAVFPNEAHFYEEIWPEFYKFGKNFSVDFDKIPKYYSSQIGTEHYDKIVLEDLRYENFELYDKTKALDKEHFELIFKSYGVYHALSFAYREQHLEEYLKLISVVKDAWSKSNEKDDESANKFADYINDQVRYAIDLFDKEKHADILRVLEKYKKESATIFAETGQYNGEYSVYLHGDCWSNNMMFKYDENRKVKDVRFLDFQIIRSGTPVSDLSYCIYSGASKDILDKLDDYLKIWHDSFSDTLEKLDCHPKNSFTFEVFKNEWKKYCPYGIFFGIMLWRIKLVDKKHIPKISGSPPAGLPKIAQEHLEEFNLRLKDLLTHGYENNFL